MPSEPIKDCYLTSTGSFLPGDPVGNESIPRFLGTLEGESEVAQRVLRMNGIVARHYAQDEQLSPTETVYSMASVAVERAMEKIGGDGPITFLSAGATYAPLAAPGIASLIHDSLSSRPGTTSRFSSPLEISSHAGVCTSSAAGLVAAIRAVQSGIHSSAVALGTEHSSEVLKSSKILPIDDRSDDIDVRKTRWFMSVFLRFMLSDGAGAFVLQDRPAQSALSLKVNWTFSRSFANRAPLCMKLDNANALLSQDVDILSRHLIPCAEEFAELAFSHNNDSLNGYRWVLPHLSSFFFRRRMERILNRYAGENANVEHWTNLATAGNTGAASIFVMLDQFLCEERSLRDGDRIMLFIPESGQFNFVMVSLTVILP